MTRALTPTVADARSRATVVTPDGPGTLLAVTGNKALVLVQMGGTSTRHLRYPIEDIALTAGEAAPLPPEAQLLPTAAYRLLAALVAHWVSTGTPLHIEEARQVAGLGRNAARRASRRLRHLDLADWGTERDTLVPLVTLHQLESHHHHAHL